MRNPRGPAPWRDLPGTLPAACAALVTELRELKDRGRLSLVELAEATAISKSSWERYLNGKQFPPRHAVEALCRAVREPGDRVLARWALADADWSRRGLTDVAAQPAGPDGPRPSGGDAAEGPSGQPPPHRAGFTRRTLAAASALITARPWTTAAVVAAVCASMLAPALVIHAERTTAAAPPPARPPICRLGSCEGRDPRTTACEDPTTLASRTTADGTRLQLRLSPSCAAGWVRAWPTHPGFRIEITGPGARHEAADGGSASAGPELVTTPMIAAPRPERLRVCYYPAAGRPGRECFAGATAGG